MIPFLFISDQWLSMLFKLNILLGEMLGTRSKQYKNSTRIRKWPKFEDDFGIPSDWNFFATAHVQGCWDGLVGSVKCQATLVSSSRPVVNQILTPEYLIKIIFLIWL